MAGRPKGQAKTGGRGKGTPNKRTAEFRERLVSLNCDPLQVLAMIVNGEETQPVATGKNDDGTFIVEDLPPTWELRAKYASDLLNYEYPKRKAVEITGADGNELKIRILDGSADTDD